MRTVFTAYCSIIFANYTTNVRATNNSTFVTIAHTDKLTFFCIPPNNAAYIRSIRSNNSIRVHSIFYNTIIQISAVLSYNAAKILCATTTVYSSIYMQFYIIISIGNGTSIQSGNTANILITCNTSAVNQVIIIFICGNCTSIAACNTADILHTSNGRRTVVNKVC